MIKLENVNGFSRILEFGMPLADVVFSHSPSADTLYVHQERVRELIEKAEKYDAATAELESVRRDMYFANQTLDSMAIRHRAEIEQFRRENVQMADAIRELKRQLREMD